MNNKYDFTGRSGFLTLVGISQNLKKSKWRIKKM